MEGFGAPSIPCADVGAEGDQVFNDVFLIGGCGDMQGGIAGINVVFDCMQVVC